MLLTFTVGSVVVVADDVPGCGGVLSDVLMEPDALPLTEPLEVLLVAVLERSGVDVAELWALEGVMGPAVAAEGVPVSRSRLVVVAVEPGVEIAVLPDDCFSVLLDGVAELAELVCLSAPEVAGLCEVAV